MPRYVRAMDFGVLVPLMGILLAAWAAYQAGVRQDSRRWLRERRAELYVDLLVEAHAEKEWALAELVQREVMEIDADPESRLEAGREWRQEHDRLIPDLHLKPKDRALLGARMAAYATPEVIALFHAIGRGVAFRLPSGRYAIAFEVEEAFDAFEERVRRELGNPPGEGKRHPLSGRWRLTARQ